MADYIALENVAAARELVQRVLVAVERFQKFPRMGSLPNELMGLPYRQLVVSPCRVFYRVEKRVIYIVHVLRGEQFVRRELFPTEARASRSSGK